LKESVTWDVVPMPQERNVVGCKWVFKLKSPHVEGEAHRYNARLVAKSSEREGIDYHETFAPVIKYQPLRLLMALAIEKDMHIHQIETH
jgi:Reverse transcriptase (RNA-dependent DNA polymerase)